jgi:LysR family transcriptional regulator, glycine cleavage system transcriptional activator
VLGARAEKTRAAREPQVPPKILRGLVVFCAAARYLSFKMAANELCITPSAVSHQIKALEDRAGEALFERRTRAIVMTAAGATLYAQVDPLLRALDAATTGFFRKGRQARRTLRLSLPPFFASEMFIPRLGEFSGDHPLIDVRIETNGVRGAEYAPGSDASVLLLGEPPSEHAAYPLFRLYLVPACAPGLVRDAPASDASLFRDNVLIIHKSRPDAWGDWFRSIGASLTRQPRIIYLDSMFAVARAAEQGLGVALVPTPLIDSWFDRRALTRLSDEKLDTGEHYYFVHAHARSDDPDVRALREWITETFPLNEQ